MYKFTTFFLMLFTAFNVCATPWQAKITYDPMDDSKTGFAVYWTAAKESVQVACDDTGWREEFSLYIVIDGYVKKNEISRLEIRIDKEKAFSVDAVPLKTTHNSLYVTREEEIYKLIQSMKSGKQLHLRTHDWFDKRHYFSVSLLGFTKALNEACGWWMDEKGYR